MKEKLDNFTEIFWIQAGNGYIYGKTVKMGRSSEKISAEFSAKYFHQFNEHSIIESLHYLL